MPADWQDASSPLAEIVRRTSEEMLNAYRANPRLIEEHVGIEKQVVEGGYGRRQLFELLQNGADAITESENRGRLEVVLTESALYCANEGAPIGEGGMVAILHSHLSPKVGDSIGRFGQGFKSVLQVSRHPHFLSRPCSVRFSAEESSRIVHDSTGREGAAPVLRLATPIDPREVFRTDPIAGRLATWATTIVYLPMEPGTGEALGSDLAGFPSAFLLFCGKYVGSLNLTDQRTGLSRRIEVQREGTTFRLSENEVASAWRVFGKRVPIERLSEAEREDAGSLLRDRTQVPILWAVPLDSRRERGEFWCFAPTVTGSTLAGILNAPWKTNNDRQNLLPGAYNSALLDHAVKVVENFLRDLADPADPGRILDALPARDDLGWADKELAEKLQTALAGTACVPTVDGTYATPERVRLVPREAPEECLEEWSDFVQPRRTWAHHSIKGRERHPRAVRLGCQVVSIGDWLESYVVEATPLSSAAALRAARAVLKSKDESVRQQVFLARILLLNDGSLSPLAPARVVLSGNPPAGIGVAHPGLLETLGAREFLAELGFREEDARTWITLFFEGLARGQKAVFEDFWRKTRLLEVSEAVQLLSEQNRLARLRIRSAKGDWRRRRSIYLPGALKASLSLDPSEAGVFVDDEFHAPDQDLLRALALCEGPAPQASNEDEEWYSRYSDFATSEYRRRLPTGSRMPQQGKLQLIATSSLGPLEPLEGLSPANQSEVVRRLLEALSQLDTPKVWHSSSRSYPAQAIEPPAAVWYVKETLSLPTSLGPRRAEDAVGPAFSPWADFMPVVDCSAALAGRLGLPDVPKSIPDAAWNAAFVTALTSENESALGTFYAAAARLGKRPDQIRCRLGGEWANRSPSRAIAVGVASAISGEGSDAVLRVESAADAHALARAWGLAHRGKSISEIRFSPSEAGEEILDLFPSLAALLPPESRGVRLQPCSEVEVHGPEGWETPASGVERDGMQIVYLDDTTEDVLLERVVDLLGLPVSMDGAMELRKQQGLQLIERAAQAQSLQEKLLVLVGATEIRKTLPPDLIGSIRDLRGVPATDVELAEIALALHGESTLRLFRDRLGRRGLSPPVQWTGGARAVAFVRQLGFPDAFGGMERIKRRPFEDVGGPVELPPLHDFQSAIVDRLVAHLGATQPKRGLLCLPTGAGKTRVTIESVVRHLAGRGPEKPVLWVAQTDELCEQAVQSWLEVWQALGPRSRLRTDRFWSSQSNSLVAAPEGSYQVVVATYQALSSRIDQPGLDWLRDPAIVILDEAHHAVAPTYTRILETLSLSFRETTRPLIGLSATPFRGDNQVETERLVARFGGQRFDHGIFADEDAYGVLQAQGILAQVDQVVLPGEDVVLSSQEMSHLEQYSVLPRSAEARLGRIRSRNALILQELGQLPSNWPVLVFATSVAHAELLAGLLSVQAVPAQAISAETDPTQRARAIQRFRAGDLRVLTNYGVLTTGFDAPALRVIVVARPVYSQGLYQQMIGRGLRGVGNGGKERCLIINIEDNVVNFGPSLAFRHFEHLWRPEDKQ